MQVRIAKDNCRIERQNKITNNEVREKTTILLQNA